ncbi:hypothetical protein ABK040_014264 [Willaertia magna]
MLNSQQSNNNFDSNQSAERRRNILLNHLFPSSLPSSTVIENNIGMNTCSGTSSTTSNRATTTTVQQQKEEIDEDDEKPTNLIAKEVSIPVKIAGIGRYIPENIVTSETIDILCNKPKGYTQKTTGVKERRWANSVEHILSVRKRKFAFNVDKFCKLNSSEVESEKIARELKSKEITTAWMGAQAAKEALNDANFKATDMDLIVYASGTPQRPIPDTSCFLHQELGLSDTGIPSTSIHSTCLSFVVAFHLCAGLIGSGLYDKILIVSSEISTVGLNFEENPHAAGLIGDGSAAVVLTKSQPGEQSKLKKFLFATYSDGADYTTIRAGGSEFHPNHIYTPLNYQYFDMNGKKILEFTAKRCMRIFEDYQAGLTDGNMGDIKWVVPHQASYAAFHVMSEVLGWPKDNVVKTLEKFGNTISASIPMALYEAIKDGRIKRGDDVFMVGTGAGLTVGCCTFTY